MSAIPCNDRLAAASLECFPQEAAAPKPEESTYGQILKSTALIGGSSVMNIAIGIVRTKAMAVLLGPSGFGLAGLYMSVANLTQSVAGMGINSSGVRQIAEAAGSEDAGRIARTATVLRRTSVILGLLGAFLLILFAVPVSALTFGSDQRTAGVYLLSAAVFFNLVSAGQGALIQGMRRISDLAKMNVLGALFGTLITIPVVYFLREKGVAPSLVGVAAMSLFASWWYSHRIPIQTPQLRASQVRQEAAALLKLGFAFMASGLMMMGSAYLVRVIVLRKLGLEATGLYQAAWTLGGLYVGLILQAMGADFYPRLTASAHDNAACNRLVNEQARVSLLLAGPGVIATLTFAPVVIALFYATNFGAAVGVLRWICLGIALRVISWPMGYIIVAKNEQGLFLGSEVAWTVVHLGLAWVFVGRFGLNGAGIAFFGSYIFHVFLIYPIVHRLCGFRWSAENRRTGMIYLSLTTVVFCGFLVLPLLWGICVGGLAMVLSGAYSFQVLLTQVSTERIPTLVRRILATLGLIPCTVGRL